jgi:F0F1-type ATP synthase assembly protein I
LATDNRPPLVEAMRYAQAGTMIIAPMLAFGAIGYWLDGKLGTKPWLLVAGLVLGMIGGFVNFIHLVTTPPGGGGKEP